MATTVKEVVGMTYMLLNNASEEELDYVVVLQQYGVTVDEMQHERISGYRNPEIRKAQVTFADDTGIVNDTLTDFMEDIVLLRFNESTVEEVSSNMLNDFKDMNQQAVSFYKDLSSGTAVAKIELAIKTAGVLEIWYEPRTVASTSDENNILVEDAYKFLLATRLAFNCCKYAIYKDPVKEANKPLMMTGLREQASRARDLYLDKVNKIGSGNRPYSRLPYYAG